MGDITIDYTNVLAEAVGKKNGLSLESIQALQVRGSKIHQNLERRRKSGNLHFFNLPYEISEAKKIASFAKKLQKDFSNMVVLGIGGSALGTTALFTALRHSSHNSLSAKKRGGLRLFVEDNIDPDHFAELLETIKLKDTVFNVISKSGSTAETMSQFMIVVELLKRKIGRGWKKHLILTTDAKAGVLREIADKNKVKSFIVPDGVGGRFTIFTPVSLLPAAVCGIDIVKLLKGAERMDKRIRENVILKNPAYLFSAINYLLDTQSGKKMLVMMPYSNKLKDIADWFRQLWAESLGKKEDLQGNPVHVGQTPIRALGATDQHSQVQLYVAGPFDKITCFIEVENFKNKVTIPKLPSALPELPALSYLENISLNELLAVELKGTEYALTSNERPNMTIRLDEINENSIGQLLYMLEVSTLFSGGLYNINPLDQPGVEFGKEYAYAMLGRKGFEKKKQEFESANISDRKII